MRSWAFCGKRTVSKKMDFFDVILMLFFKQVVWKTIISTSLFFPRWPFHAWVLVGAAGRGYPWDGVDNVETRHKSGRKTRKRRKKKKREKKTKFTWKTHTLHIYLQAKMRENLQKKRGKSTHIIKKLNFDHRKCHFHSSRPKLAVYK